MPIITGSWYHEDPLDEFDIETDWVEEIGDTSPGSEHMSGDVQEATIVGIVASNKKRAVYRHFLGFSTADTAEPFGLYRENPAFHPELPWLRAYEVSTQEYVVLPNDEELDAQGRARPFKFSPFDITLRTAQYDLMKVTVRYRNFLYPFIEDGDMQTDGLEEWNRSTWIQTEPRQEALQMTGGQSQLTFAETGPTGPAVGTKFPAPFAELLSKKGVVVWWYDVPWEYLSFQKTVFTPTKIDAIAGHVNSDTFMDQFLPGTLLAEPYRYTISTWAVAPLDPYALLRKVTIALPFSRFDPERGAAAPTTRGHNLMPWGGNDTTTGDGKFYLATRDGTAGGRGLVPTTSFSDIFTHVLS